MSIFYWVVIGILLIPVLFGLWEFLTMFFWSWYEKGKKFTIVMTILFSLVVSQGFVKSYAPEYYGLAIWALILYIVGLLIYQHMFSREDS